MPARAKAKPAILEAPAAPKTRTETDSFGPIEVQPTAIGAAQTQRSIANFAIGWEKQPIPVVRALGHIKKAAAEANMELGKLDKKVGDAIIRAADEVIVGTLDDHFPAGRLADGLGHANQHECE